MIFGESAKRNVHGSGFSEPLLYRRLQDFELGSLKFKVTYNVCTGYNRNGEKRADKLLGNRGEEPVQLDHTSGGTRWPCPSLSASYPRVLSV